MEDCKICETDQFIEIKKIWQGSKYEIFLITCKHCDIATVCKTNACTYEHAIDDCNQAWSEFNNKDTGGLKSDEDLYEKVDYSMVPLGNIVNYLDHSVHGKAPGMSVSETDDFMFFSRIHDTINGKAPAGSINVLLEDVVAFYGIKPLAVSLGVDFSKYKERDNWMKFSNDPNRFLRVTLRHLMAIMQGADYDGEEGIEGYEKGNDHRGAVCFGLMVANNILNDELHSNKL